MRRRGRRALGVTAAAAIGLTCATLYEEPDTTLECEVDKDCPTGEVCALDQGGVCYSASLPNRAFLGMDVRENQIVSNTPTLRVEVFGLDTSVERVTNRTPNRYRVSTNNHGNDPAFPGVRDTLSLDVRSLHYYDTEQEGSLVFEPYVGLVTLSQTSRLGQSNSSRGEAGNLPFPPSVDPETMAADPLVFDWSHYDPVDGDSDRPLLLELRPQGGTEANTGVIHRILRRNRKAEADSHAITVDTTAECNRLLAGTGAILVKPGEPLENVDAIPLEVTMRYGESMPSPATIQPAPGQLGCLSDANCPTPSVCIEPGGSEPRFCGCEVDAECPSGQVCYVPENRCVLDLKDYQAYRNIDVATGSQGLFSFNAAVYTHCEGSVDESREIALVATADPGAMSGLPRLSYDLKQNFPAPTAAEDPSPTPLGGKLCLPHWRPPAAITVPMSGAPAKLYASALGETYFCCSTDCLSSTSPGSKPSSCTPESSISVSGTYELPKAEKEGDPSPWELAGCLPLYVPGVEDPTSIRFTRSPVTCKAESCELVVSSGAYDAAAPFLYDLRIEPPVGSIFRSVLLQAEVGPDTTEFPPIVLPPRVLLRGRVALADDVCTPTSVPGETETCTAAASVLAERIRLPEEEGQTIPGPYFYSLSTFGDGQFVLPVNPGVYLVTALPATGAQGGPADFQVVDLREDSALVKMSQGVPYADLGAPILLERGLLVTVELAGFGPNTTVIPLDIGSWSALAFEGMPLDLNATPTCYRASGDPPACQIRRLRPGSSTLLLSQEKFVKFITRN
ncbi:MAG: hypothetical protein R3B09_28955 [Nannocystaceae bacterium]